MTSSPCWTDWTSPNMQTGSGSQLLSSTSPSTPPVCLSVCLESSTLHPTQTSLHSHCDRCLAAASQKKLQMFLKSLPGPGTPPNTISVQDIVIFSSEKLRYPPVQHFTYSPGQDMSDGCTPALTRIDAASINGICQRIAEHV